MSNSRKLKRAVRESGASQRRKVTWSGQLGNRTTRQQLAARQLEDSKAKLHFTRPGKVQ